MRLWPALPLLSSLLAPEAFACPTCVGPRLGDSGTGQPQAHASLRASLGSDRFADTERLEWSTELSAAISAGRFHAALALPYLWRRVGEGSASGFSDLTVNGSVELFRRESPESSDTLSVAAGLGLPTARGGAEWSTLLGTQSVTPALAVQWRHSDQGWAVVARAYGAVPFAPAEAGVVFGPSVGTGAVGEYQPWRWLTLRLALDLKQQWAARQRGELLPHSQYLALFVAGEARLQPARWLAIGAAVVVPLLCVSPGAYAHGRIYRLGVELML